MTQDDNGLNATRRVTWRLALPAHDLGRAAAIAGSMLGSFGRACPIRRDLPGLDVSDASDSGMPDGDASGTPCDAVRRLCRQREIGGLRVVPAKVMPTFMPGSGASAVNMAREWAANMNHADRAYRVIRS